MKSDPGSYCGMFGQREREKGAKMVRMCVYIRGEREREREREEKSNNNGAWWLVIGKIMMPV